MTRDEIISELSGLDFAPTKPNYNMTFHRDGKQIGELDFNGDTMVFRGEAEESAKVFFDYVGQTFAKRLQDERNAGLKEAADNRADIKRLADHFKENGIPTEDGDYD